MHPYHMWALIVHLPVIFEHTVLSLARDFSRAKKKEISPMQAIYKVMGSGFRFKDAAYRRAVIS